MDHNKPQVDVEIDIGSECLERRLKEGWYEAQWRERENWGERSVAD